MVCIFVQHQLNLFFGFLYAEAGMKILIIDCALVGLE